MDAKELLIKGLIELHIECSEQKINAFMNFLYELKKWNKAYNLTALRNDHDIIIKHFLDSLLYLKALPEGPLTLADAGTGAGFPGIPLKLVRPGLDLTLIESSRKKTAFLRHITRQLGLKDTHILEKRLESLGKQYERTWDIIVTRATFSMKEFLKLACPYVKKSGRLLLSKGPKIVDELQNLTASPVTAHTIEKIWEVQLPFEKAQRNLFVLRCLSQSLEPLNP